MNQIKLNIFFVVCDGLRTLEHLEDAVGNGQLLKEYCDQNQVPLPSLWLSSTDTLAVKVGFATIEGIGRVIDQVPTAPELSLLVLDEYLLAKAMAGELLRFLDNHLRANRHPPPHLSVIVTANRAWIEPGVAFLLLPDAAAATREAVAIKLLEKFPAHLPKRPIVVLGGVADLDSMEFNFAGLDRIGAFADEYVDPNLTSNVRLMMVSDQDKGPTAQPDPNLTGTEQAWLDNEPDADASPQPDPPGFWRRLIHRIRPTKNG